MCVYNINNMTYSNDIFIYFKKRFFFNSSDYYNNVIVEKNDMLVKNYIQKSDNYFEKLINEKNIYIFNILILFLQTYNSKYSLYYMDNDLDKKIEFILSRLETVFNYCVKYSNSKYVRDILLPNYIIYIHILRNIEILNFYNSITKYELKEDDLKEKYIIRLKLEDFTRKSKNDIYEKCKKNIKKIKDLKIIQDIIIYRNNILDDEIINYEIFPYFAYNIVPKISVYLRFFDIKNENEYQNYFLVINFSNIIFDNSKRLKHSLDANIYHDVINSARLIKYYAYNLNRKYVKHIIINSNLILYEDNTHKLIQRNDFSNFKLTKIISVKINDDYILTYKNKNFYISNMSLIESIMGTGIFFLHKNPFAYSNIYWNKIKQITNIIPGCLILNNHERYSKDIRITYEFENISKFKKTYMLDDQNYLKEIIELNLKENYVDLKYHHSMSNDICIKKNLDFRIINSDTVFTIDNNPIKKSGCYYGKHINITDPLYGNNVIMLLHKSNIFLNFVENEYFEASIIINSYINIKYFYY